MNWASPAIATGIRHPEYVRSGPARLWLQHECRTKSETPILRGRAVKQAFMAYGHTSLRKASVPCAGKAVEHCLGPRAAWR